MNGVFEKTSNIFIHKQRTSFILMRCKYNSHQHNKKLFDIYVFIYIYIYMKGELKRKTILLTSLKLACKEKKSVLFL